MANRIPAKYFVTAIKKIADTSNMTNPNLESSQKRCILGLVGLT